MENGSMTSTAKTEKTSGAKKPRNLPIDPERWLEEQTKRPPYRRQFVELEPDRTPIRIA